MNNKEILSKKLIIDNQDQIANIWKESLPENLKSIIGKRIIYKYIEEFFSNKKNLAYGIFKSNDLIGFVFFGNDNNIISKILFRNFFFILKSLIFFILSMKFDKIYYYFDVFIFLIFSKIKRRNIDNSTELLIICLKKNYQNKGFGSYLIKDSLSNNKDYFKEFNKISVMTLKKTPQNIQFYKKNNFKFLYSFYGRIFLVLSL